MSSDATQFNHPVSCFVNSSLVEDTPLNSFCSPRAGSVTVVGKRIYSHSCISPTTIEESPKFPVPIQVYSRIKRHNTQVKKLLKHKTTKTKCQEQPAPPLVKLQPSKPTISVMKKREVIKEKEKSMPSIKSCPKLLPKEESKVIVPLSERSTVKISQIIKKSVQIELRKKKKAEIQKQLEKEYKKHKKQQLQKKNSKIRFENSMKFKMEKFTPKAAWGIDERKHSEQERQKIIKEIEKQRTARRELKRSPAYLQKKGLGLSKLLEIEQELGFKPRSSSMVAETPISTITRKQPDPKIKKYIKEKKRKNKEIKTDELIETIKNETKRIASLKKLDLQSLHEATTTRKSVKKMQKYLQKTKKSTINKDSSDESDNIDKIYEDRPSSDFIFEPGSDLKQGFSGFTEETEQQPEPPKETSFKIKEKAAIKIQSNIRRFLVRKRYKMITDSFHPEDAEVKGILTAWQQNNIGQPETISFDPNSQKFLLTENQLQNLEEMKQKEISEVLEVTKQLNQDPEIIESLTKMIGARYEHITNMLQSSSSGDNIHFNRSLGNQISNIPCIDPSSNITEGYEKELQEGREGRLLDFSFPSYKSDKSQYENSLLNTKKSQPETIERVDQNPSPSEIVIFQDFKIKNDSLEEENEEDEDKNENALIDTKEKLKGILISRASPISPPSEESHIDTPLVTAEIIAETCESLIQKLMAEILASQSIAAKSGCINKDTQQFIDELTPFVNSANTEFKIAISKPLRRNPLELLARMQEPDHIISLDKDFSTCPAIINPMIFIDLNTSRKCQDKDLKDSQTAHDKLIFDNCNEILQQHRPYGLEGTPAPWSSTQRILKFDIASFQSILPEIRNEIDKLDKFKAGKIADQSFLSSSGNEEGLQNAREEKIGMLIAEDIQTRESIWVNYEFEETQTKLDLADHIAESLIFEIVEIMSS